MNQQQDCQYVVLRQGNEVLVMLSGILRMYNGERIKTELLPLMEPPVEFFYVHIGRLSEIDSAGLGVLVGLHMTARKKKVQCRFLSPNQFQMKLFETTRLNSVLTLVSGVEAETIRTRLEASATT